MTEGRLRDRAVNATRGPSNHRSLLRTTLEIDNTASQLVTCYALGECLSGDDGAHRPLAVLQCGEADSASAGDEHAPTPLALRQAARLAGNRWTTLRQPLDLLQRGLEKGSPSAAACRAAVGTTSCTQSASNSSAVTA
jgi:hypothetical protein